MRSDDPIVNLADEIKVRIYSYDRMIGHAQERLFRETDLPQQILGTLERVALVSDWFYLVRIQLTGLMDQGDLIEEILRRGRAL